MKRHVLSLLALLVLLVFAFGCGGNQTVSEGKSSEGELKGANAIKLTSEVLAKLLMDNGKGNDVPTGEKSPVYEVQGTIDYVRTQKTTASGEETRGKVTVGVILPSYPKLTCSATFGIHRMDEMEDRLEGSEIRFKGRLMRISSIQGVGFEPCFLIE